MELVIAMVLFIGLIGSWIMLPGSTTSTAVVTEVEQFDLTGVERAQVGQLA